MFRSSESINKLRDKSINHNHQNKKILFASVDFVVITACFNVENYIDQMVDSLINQSLDFVNNITLILVNDGSTDNTLSLLRKFEQKYPKNITVVNSLCNVGVSKARNLGLDLLEPNKYVTFIDGDDYVDNDYFYNVYKCIEDNLNLVLLSCNKKFYFEKNNLVVDSHPLKYKFTDNVGLKIKNLGKYFDNSVNSNFFKSNIIINRHLRFDCNLKKFEDGFFLNSYLCLCNKNDMVFFNKNSTYFYRKRHNKSSAIDMCYEQSSTYVDVLKYAYLPLVNMFEEKYGYIPKYVQYLIIYDYFWMVKYNINLPKYIYEAYLSPEDLQDFWSLSKEIFSKIENKSILSFNFINGVSLFYKFIMTVGFKSSYPNSNQNSSDPFTVNIVYVDYFEIRDNILSFHFYVPNDSNIDFCLKTNDSEVKPDDVKIQLVSLFDIDILNIFNVKYRVGRCHDDDLLNFFVGDLRCTISYSGKIYNSGIALSEFRGPSRKAITKQLPFYESIYRKYNFSFKFKNCWLIMDRPNNVADNGEFFYRYLKNNHPEVNCFFVLNEHSPSYSKLEKDGFLMIPYGSELHQLAYYLSKYIISSDFTDDCINPFKSDLLYQKKLVFLQHGIIRDDLSLWLNSKKKVDLFICSTELERNSIVDNFTRYSLLPSQVHITGLSRFDNLARIRDANADRIVHGRKCMLIQPSWRSYLKNVSDVDFINSEYFKNWSNFLKSDLLFNFHGLNNDNQIIFAVHPHMIKYIHLFDLPNYIIVNADNTLYQDNFVACDILITDYSSVMCDVGLLSKPVIYFQFDQDCFWKNHTYRKGYFSYDQDGFGPVCTSLEMLIRNVDEWIKNNFDFSLYFNRYARFFQNSEKFDLLDGKCSERIYHKILKIR